MNSTERMATVFGIGKYFKKGGGTAASVVTLPLAWVMAQGAPELYAFATIMMLAGGIVISQVYEQMTKTHDSSEIVIDEVVGMLITLMLIPTTPVLYLLGFLLFRFFDILKPFPIGLIDKKMPGGVGVMADDVAAGIISNIILHVLISQFPAIVSVGF